MQQQKAGSQFVVQHSEMAPFSPSAVGSGAHLLGIPGPGPDPLQQPPMTEAASPISSRTPARPPTVDFDELAPAVAGNCPDDQALAGGEDAERGGGATGNRWSRQETLALLKIRSEMDAAFRDATFKGPLWEEVCRKLGELGYKRSAKKCKEKFENVHKYYKRTKEGRAGRQDGRSYRFVSQLEALYSGSSDGGATTSTANRAPAPPLAAASSAFSAGMAGPPISRPQPISATAPPTMATPTRVVVPDLALPGGLQGLTSSAVAGITFSWNSSSSSSSSDSDGEETGDAGENQEGRKRKHGGGSGTSRKMMAFFDRLMNQVMERQDAMQQRFLEAIEKRDQDRMIRDEAWRRQEMERLNRERELSAQDRVMAASRDTAIISYLQKISGQTVPVPPMPATPISIAPLSPQQPSQHPHERSQPPRQQQQTPRAPAQSPQNQVVRHKSSSASEIDPTLEPQEAVGSGSLEPMPSSSRWPKAEVHALINLRSGLESKYQDAGPKGTLWEEISAGMQRLGYNRSAKRCKEKWENINKYFKKVKESNKKRPEDSKTCPYFHQLDAIYRKKLLSSGGTSSGSGNIVGIQRQQVQEANPTPNQQKSDAVTLMPQEQAPPPPQEQAGSKNGKDRSSNNQNGGNSEGGEVSVGIQVPTSNGGLPPRFFGEGLNKELMGQRQQQAAMDDYAKLDEADSDNMDQNDDNDDDDEEDRKMQYTIQFQKQNVNAGGSGGSGSAAASPGSFLAIVQ
ncbi:SANT [Musa troglodytarum]|uniref:SANT n=1 Tax=Musa troglodytarum TaxID=320322 RepID=A0A9E7FIL6_9LILI|nr:SANT [Musa troglodytarum]